MDGSAWSAANGISLGQVKVDDKSNEVIQSIIERDANYIIAIKDYLKKELSTNQTYH